MNWRSWVYTFPGPAFSVTSGDVLTELTPPRTEHPLGADMMTGAVPLLTVAKLGTRPMGGSTPIRGITWADRVGMHVRMRHVWVGVYDCVGVHDCVGVDGCVRGGGNPLNIKYTIQSVPTRGGANSVMRNCYITTLGSTFRASVDTLLLLPCTSKGTHPPLHTGAFQQDHAHGMLAIEREYAYQEKFHSSNLLCICGSPG